ncbi:arginine--tRNA ligase, partial [Candidatus Woesearchaeota archaeon]|nr:arginine--tRNA ligase [Candidatus Woesearchaeota archaeon]
LQEAEIDKMLSVPPDQKLGDFAFPCFVLSKQEKKPPVEIAKDLAGKIKPGKNLEKVEAVGPYLNFFLNKSKLNEETLTSIEKEKDGFGKGEKKKEKVMVEYHQPNTHKAFHIGHLRNAVLGDAIIRAMRFAGYDVVAATYMGDIGMHVAKVLWYLNKYHKGPFPDKNRGEWLGEIYVKAHREYEKHETHEKEVKELLQKYESGDKELHDLWIKTRQWSLDDFEKIEKELGLNIDVRFYESEVDEEGKEKVLEAKNKGIVVESEGALIIDLENYNLGVFLVLKNDGTSLYSTKDIALAERKFGQHKIDKSLYVIGSEQKMYMQQLFKSLELIGFKQAKQCQHISYELVTLKEGKMSSRAGTGISYNDFKNQMLEKAGKEVRKRHKDWKSEDIEKAITQVAFAALKFTMLHQDNNKKIIFDMDKALDFEGETGPYVQYAHARACSVLRKAGSKPKTDVKFELLGQEIEKKVILLLDKFPEVIQQVAQSYRPMLLTRYSIDLAQAFNEFYHSCQILKEEEDLKDARLLLVDCAKQVLKNVLSTLGIEAPEQM